MNMRVSLLNRCFLAVIAALSISSSTFGQASLGPRFEITPSVDTFDLIVGSSQRLKFDYNVPELMVERPDVISATPVTPNEILITGIKQGISTITVSDPDKNLQMITVNVTLDVRKLERAISTHFPDSQVQVAALQTSVLLKGNVARADQIQNIMAVARDYFPSNVINELHVNGSQNIAIKVKIYEVSRSKLRQLGIDWSLFGDNFNIVSSVSELIQSVSTGGVAATGQTLSFGVLNDSNTFNAFIQALEKNNLAKLLDQPVLVAQNGRPAEFLSGGEIPIEVASGLGTNSIEFRPFGTKLDIVPIVHGQGMLTLEVRAEVSEIAPDLSGSTGVPGFRVRRVNTGVRMKAGHTLALAGDYREKVQTELKGLPKFMDSPWFGPAFRSVKEETNETELVFLITPRFISEVEPDSIPRYGPGQLTTSPTDHELYINGYTEVPRCNDDCPVDDRFDDPIARRQALLQSAKENLNPTNAFQQGQTSGSYDQQAPVTYQFSSSQRFPGKDSSRTTAQPVKPVRSGFLWPSKGKR